MTDNEIIKALDECPLHENCHKCPFEETGCDLGMLCYEVGELINRQKAEIKRLKHECDLAKFEQYKSEFMACKAEILTDFAERLKKEVFNTEYHVDRAYRKTIDKFVKEEIERGYSS